MKKSNTYWVALAALAAGLGMASNAHASWTFTGTSAPTGSIADSAGGASLTSYTGVAANNGGSLSNAWTPNVTVLSEANAATTSGAAGFASGATWASTPLVWNGASFGWGMQSDATVDNVPNHALDNGPATGAGGVVTGVGNTEGMLLGFSGSVSLNAISLGYKAGDADVSVFRYTGSGTPTLSGASLSSMTTNGWSLVGNYADLNGSTAGGATNNNINTGGASSSWWLITAYNSAYGTGSGLSQGNDYFKILGVSAGTSCKTGTTGCVSPADGSLPEPTSLALVAIAGLGFVGARRRVLKGHVGA